MGVLDFVFRIFTVIVIAFVIIGTVCTIWDDKDLKEENKKLKEDLMKARETKIKREYKKASKVGGKNNEKK